MSSTDFTSTENGAVALKSSGNPIVDYFMMFARTITNEKIEKYMDLCWDVNPKKTVAIIFNGRDRENGKKEKNISNRAMIWLRNNKPLTYQGNLIKYIDKYGCWKDIMYINFNFDKKVINCLDKDYELSIIANRLIKDKDTLENGNKNDISLCAKWAPSENDKYDKRRKSAKKVAAILFPDDLSHLMANYRKEYLTPLRNQLKIVETLMCENKWTEIKYETVPAVASKRLKKAFMKHDPDGYSKFLEDVKSGKKSIKVTGILPHELIKYYIDLSANQYSFDENNENKYEPNETIEMQWKTIVENVKKEGVLEGLLPIVDVSGSMFSTSNGSIPAQVAIALGILISDCSTGPFSNKVLTFSRKPEFYHVKGDTLFEKFNNIKSMDAGTDTNFEATSDLIINYGKMFNVKQEDMPKKLVCLSDMQFNQASCDRKYKEISTLHKHIVNKYKNNNYEAPSFIYWNLNSDNNNDETFPVSSTEPGTALISGFSEQLLKVFMKHDNFTPELIVDEILSPYIDEVYIDESEYMKGGDYYPINNNMKEFKTQVNNELKEAENTTEDTVDDTAEDYSDMPDLIPDDEENTRPSLSLFNMFIRRT